MARTESTGYPFSEVSSCRIHRASQSRRVATAPTASTWPRKLRRKQGTAGRRVQGLARSRPAASRAVRLYGYDKDGQQSRRTAAKPPTTEARVGGRMSAILSPSLS